MLKIRLTRTGKKNSPSYRVVVADKQRAVKRKFIEIIGNYNPTLTPKQLVIDKDRALFWMERGAQPSDTVNNLLVRLEILGKDKKINKVFGKKLTKKAIKEGPKEEKVEVEKEEATTEATDITKPEAKEDVIAKKPEENAPKEIEEASDTETRIEEAVTPEPEKDLDENIKVESK